MAAFNKRPLAYVCFLCGQQYGSQSLHIHIPQCAAKWCKQHDKTSPPAAPPELPQSADQLPKGAAAINAFIAIMMAAWEGGSLERCPHCGRTFRLEALEHHSRACTAAKPFKPLSGHSSQGRQRAAGSCGQPAAEPVMPPMGSKLVSSTAGKLEHNTAASRHGGSPGRGSPGGNSHSAGSGSGVFGGSGRMPKAFICFLCGQQYGSKSLLIHYPQCQTKWVQQQQQLPPLQRLHLPSPPDDLQDYMTGVTPLPTTDEAVTSFNAVAFEAFNSGSLVPCKNCGRTFRPEALARHASFCTVERPMKKK